MELEGANYLFHVCCIYYEKCLEWITDSGKLQIVLVVVNKWNLNRHSQMFLVFYKKCNAACRRK